MSRLRGQTCCWELGQALTPPSKHLGSRLSCCLLSHLCGEHAPGNSGSHTDVVGMSCHPTARHNHPPTHPHHPRNIIWPLLLPSSQKACLFLHRLPDFECVRK